MDTGRDGHQDKVGNERTQRRLARQLAQRQTGQEHARARRRGHEQGSDSRRDAAAPGPTEERGPIVARHRCGTGQRPGGRVAGDRPAEGPMAPFGQFEQPHCYQRPAPATSYSPVPETVPLPTSRKSTPARRLGHEIRKWDRAGDKTDESAGLTPTPIRPLPWAIQEPMQRAQSSDPVQQTSARRHRTDFSQSPFS